MTAVDRYLRAPRLPKTCPVVVLHLKAPSDYNGNPRRCFAVLATAGRLVEVHDEGYSGDQDVKRRWPWLDLNARDGLKLFGASMVSVEITPREYREWIKAGENRDTHRASEITELSALRKLGDRCAQYRAVIEALSEIRRARAVGEMRKARGMDTSVSDGTALIYHRHLDDGGDVVSDFLRRALIALNNAGMVERVPTETDPQPFFARSVGRYHATETTPNLETTR